MYWSCSDAGYCELGCGEVLISVLKCIGLMSCMSNS